ncbi:MAG: hypothetical protein ACLQUY_19470 [Ktedonobacterales bacterium]
MSAEKMMVNVVDPDGKWLYRVGGISALLLGIAYIITIALYAHVGAPPSGGEAWLQYLAGKTTAWWAIVGLSVLADCLFVPVALALYLALKGVNRNAMLVATALVGLFSVLDLAVTEPNYGALITLSGPYAAATNGAQRAIYVAAANYPSAVLASRLEVVYSIMVLAVGILVTAFVMLKGTLGKSTAYLGLVTGIVGIIPVAGSFFVSALSVAIIITSVLTILWVLLVGYRLFRLGQL